jgi:hypothetical protein
VVLESDDYAIYRSWLAESCRKFGVAVWAIARSGVTSSLRQFGFERTVFGRVFPPVSTFPALPVALAGLLWDKGA